MKNKLTTYWLLFLFVFAINDCRPKAKDNEKITGIKIVISFPAATMGDEKNSLKDSIFIFWHRDFTLYKKPYQDSKNFVTIDSVGNYIDHKTISTIKYRYFGYKNASHTGIKYDSATAVTGSVQIVDSFVNKFGGESFGLDPNSDESYDLIDSSIKAGILIKRYAAKKTADPSWCDSNYMYFSDKIDDIPFSLDKGTIKNQRKKLYKIRYLFNAKYDKVHSVMVPKREVSVEMERVEIKSRHEEVQHVFMTLESVKK